MRERSRREGGDYRFLVCRQLCCDGTGAGAVLLLLESGKPGGAARPDLEETSRFPNVELLETDEDFVYFDMRDNLAASPVQTYLELARGDKREQETAEQVRKAILQPLKRKG